MENGYKKLWGILEWREEGRWRGWKKISSLTRLANKLNFLFKLLAGSTSFDPNISDYQGWERNDKGYNSMFLGSPFHSISRMWKYIW